MYLQLTLKWFRKIMINTYLYFVCTPRGGVGWGDDKAMEAKCLPPRDWERKVVCRTLLTSL